MVTIEEAKQELEQSKREVQAFQSRIPQTRMQLAYATPASQAAVRAEEKSRAVAKTIATGQLGEREAQIKKVEEEYAIALKEQEAAIARQQAAYAAASQEASEWEEAEKMATKPSVLIDVPTSLREKIMAIRSQHISKGDIAAIRAQSEALKKINQAGLKPIITYYDGEGKLTGYEDTTKGTRIAIEDFQTYLEGLPSGRKELIEQALVEPPKLKVIETKIPKTYLFGGTQPRVSEQFVTTPQGVMPTWEYEFKKKTGYFDLPPSPFNIYPKTQEEYYATQKSYAPPKPSKISAFGVTLPSITLPQATFKARKQFELFGGLVLAPTIEQTQKAIYTTGQFVESQYKKTPAYPLIEKAKQQQAELIQKYYTPWEQAQLKKPSMQEPLGGMIALSQWVAKGKEPIIARRSEIETKYFQSSPYQEQYQRAYEKAFQINPDITQEEFAKTTEAKAIIDKFYSSNYYSQAQEEIRVTTTPKEAIKNIFFGTLENVPQTKGEALFTSWKTGAKVGATIGITMAAPELVTGYFAGTTAKEVYALSTPKITMEQKIMSTANIGISAGMLGVSKLFAKVPVKQPKFKPKEEISLGLSYYNPETNLIYSTYNKKAYYPERKIQYTRKIREIFGLPPVTIKVYKPFVREVITTMPIVSTRKGVTISGAFIEKRAGFKIAKLYGQGGYYVGDVDTLASLAKLAPKERFAVLEAAKIKAKGRPVSKRLALSMFPKETKKSIAVIETRELGKLKTKTYPIEVELPKTKVNIISKTEFAGGEWGIYSPITKEIYLQKELPKKQLIRTFYHEKGHYYYDIFKLEEAIQKLPFEKQASLFRKSQKILQKEYQTLTPPYLRKNFVEEALAYDLGKIEKIKVKQIETSFETTLPYLETKKKTSTLFIVSEEPKLIEFKKKGVSIKLKEVPPQIKENLIVSDIYGTTPSASQFQRARGEVSQIKDITLDITEYMAKRKKPPITFIPEGTSDIAKESLERFIGQARQDILKARISPEKLVLVKPSPEQMKRILAATKPSPSIFPTMQQLPIPQEIKAGMFMPTLAKTEVIKTTIFETQVPKTYLEVSPKLTLTTIQKPIVTTIQKPITKTIEKTMLKPVLKPIEMIISKPMLKTTQKPMLKVMQKVALKTTQKMVTTTALKPTTPPRPPTTIMIFPSTTTAKEKALASAIKKVAGYEVFVRRKGMFKKVGGVYAKGEAIKKGEKEALRTLAATFKIKPSKGEILAYGAQEYIPTPKEFRTYAIRRGKRIPIKEQWIQKRGRRLGRRTEIKELQRARYKTNIKMKGGII